MFQNLNLSLRILAFALLAFPVVNCFGYSQNFISNPGFESGSSLPWNIWLGNNYASVTIETGNQFNGNFCAKLFGESVFLYQSFLLEPNRKYKITAHLKTQAGQVAYLGAKGFGGTEVSVAFSGSQYKADSLFFTTGNNPENITQIFIWKPDGTGAAWVDDVTLFVDGLSSEEIGGFGNYYISPQGNDTNTGNSPDQAWKTIQRVNQVNFEPSDHILFEGGNAFKGTLQFNLSDTGTVDKNIYLGSYGNGKATINATTGTGLNANKSKYLTIKNLDFIGSGRKTGNTGNGISLTSCSDVIIDSVEISGFQHSGLITLNDGKNYYFTNIYAHDNGFAGISISGYTKTSQSSIYIGNCRADNNPGDPTILTNHSGNGIIAFNASNIIIEYCEASNNGWDMPRKGNGPGGIWVAEVDSAIIQYCIAHDNKTSAGGGDGLGFDLDGGTTNSIIQYCLSYNNQGAGYGVFQYPGATKWENNTIRYCISENDGNISGIGSVCFWNGTMNINQFRNFEFYNNVVYNSEGPALNFVDHFNGYFNLRNNIFVSKDESVYNGILHENFQGNCWYSLNNEFVIGTKLDFNQWALDNNQEMYNGEIVGMYVDPKFLNPGKSIGINPLALSNSTDYNVSDDSEVIDAGLDLQFLFSIDPGLHDYFGSQIKIGKSVDLGVFENPNAAAASETTIETFDWVKIYPNPISEGQFIISILASNSKVDAWVSIYDITGRPIARFKQTVGSMEYSLSEIQIANGIYVIKVKQGTSLSAKRIVINHK